jgi:hypothetical protein
MHRPLPITLLLIAVLAAALGCPDPEPAERVEVSAVELHRAFMDDDEAARGRFRDNTLVISGEVAQAEPRFIGTTMGGEVEVEPRISFKTQLDTLPTDVKYVVVEGAFDTVDPDVPWTLDPRIQVGSTAQVECPGSTIRWSEPGLYLSDCSLAME